MRSLALLFLLMGRTTSLDPEMTMTVSEIIRYWGYPVEKYDVFTKDGYIIDLYRIPSGRHGNGSDTSTTPLLLVPGLFSSAACFVQNPPESSPALYLADAGFDVYLLSNRGTRYGLRHARLTPNDRDFWKFTLDDYANGDLPAVIDKVLSISGEQSLNLIAHSQGTGTSFMFLSDNPEYNIKIRRIFALTPMGTINYTRGLARVILMNYQILRPIFRIHRFLFGPQQIGNQHVALIRTLAEHICPHFLSGQICDSLWIWGGGPPSPSFNRSRQPVYFSHYPDGTSSMVIEHFGQMAVSNEIRHFDADPFSEASKLTTARYNYSNIDVPIYLFWSRNDWLTAPKEIEQVLIPRMRKGVIKETFEIPQYNHVDFIFATDNAARVFTVIAQTITREESYH